MLSTASSFSVFTKAGISPVTASPRSWIRHILITLFLSRSENCSPSSIAISARRQLCSATLSCRPDDVHEWRVLHFSFSVLSKKSRKLLYSMYLSSLLFPRSFLSPFLSCVPLPVKQAKHSFSLFTGSQGTLQNLLLKTADAKKASDLSPSEAFPIDVLDIIPSISFRAK